tara:strand:- start:237 stop:527 length:291 start_codon:yes stop_codon:yes gene_type:complete
MSRFKTIVTPLGQSQVEVEGAELAALEDAESAYNADAPNRAWAALREERNNRLAETDWLSMPDSPTMSDSAASYRQALRDLPAATADPAAPVWPVL